MYCLIGKVFNLALCSETTAVYKECPMFFIIKKLRFLFLFIVLISFFYLKAVSPSSEWFFLKDWFFIFLIIVSILVIGHKEKWLISVMLLILLIEAFIHLLSFFIALELIEVIEMTVSSLFCILMAVACIYISLKDKTISITTMFGPLSAYLFIGLFFAYIYIMMQLLLPSSFQGLDTEHHATVFYFSFVIMTTLGLGDIVPLTPLAQTTVWIESYSGQCYLAIIMGQLVGRYVAEQMRNKA